MGWYYTYGATRRDIIDKLNATRSWSRESDGLPVRIEVEKHCLRGNVLWQVIASSVDGVVTQRYIACNLLDRGRGDGWGYKPMDESMGPYYLTCPLSYLEGLSEPQGFAAEWREKVRKFHANA